MRLILIPLLLCLLLVVCTQAHRPFYRSVWSTWKRIYEKTYSSPSEETFRMRIFRNNFNFVRWHNRRYYSGDATYYVALNAFADLSLKEFADMYLTLRQTPFGNNSWDFRLLHDSPWNPVPKYIDWRKKGLVTPVKNQGSCGSCWAFSATGSLEGQLKKRKARLISLSEQQLVDCSQNQGNQGCNGGLMEYAFRYWMQSGAESERDYPYTAENGSCQFNNSKAIITVKKLGRVKSKDEDQLKLSVAKVGPVSVAIDASSMGFQFYKKGIYKDSECSQDRLDHGVLAVGYGQDKTGNKYWIVKNSWGTSWGNEGYIWMARDNDNMCGIATEASYPIL